MTPAEYKATMLAAKLYQQRGEQIKRLQDELDNYHRIDLRMNAEDEEVFDLVRHRTPDAELDGTAFNPVLRVIEPAEPEEDIIGISIDQQRKISLAAMLTAIGVAAATLILPILYWL